MRLVDQSTRATIRTLTILAAITSLLMVLVTPFASPAHAATLTAWPTAPYYSLGLPHNPAAVVYTVTGFGGNATCSDLDSATPGELKFEGGDANTAGTRTKTSGDGLLTVTLTVWFEQYQGQNWIFYRFSVPDSSPRGVSSVFSKVSTTGAYFDYPTASRADSYLHSVEAHQDDISHISFCYSIVPPTLVPLTAVKTAAGTYDRTVTWELDKSVDEDFHEGVAGEDAGSSTWTVEATKTEVESNFSVTGNITISNSNEIPVSVAVADTLNDGTVATVDCDPVTAGNQSTGIVPAKGSLLCSYTASPTGRTATLNTATITSNTLGVGGTTATAPVSFTENLIGFDSGTLADPRFEYSEVISSSKTKTFPETFPCPRDPNEYTDGVHVRTETNTATLNGNLNLSDSADVDIRCTLEPGDPSKTASGTYDRTITWELDKSVDVDAHQGTGGADAGTSTWTVEATKTEVEDNFQVTGTITVTNPAATTQTFTVTDELSDGTVASVDCDGEGSNEITLAGGESGDCTYEAFPTDASAEENTVTISAPGNADQEFTIAIVWTENVIGDDEVVVDDDRDTQEQFPATISDSTTFTYDETFTCSSDLSDYTNGSLSDTYVNTATLTGDNTDLESSAEVEVTCTVPQLIIEKEVENNHGGQLGEDDFAPTLEGPDGPIEVGEWGQIIYLLPGTYTVGEDDLPAGYVMTDIDCGEFGSLADDESTVEVAIGAGDAVVCTITNEDQPATLTLVKTVVNNDGGTLEADDFPVFVNDDEVAWGTEISIPAGEHAVSETQQPGYLAGPWGGDCAADGTLNAEVGGTYTCTITNDDLPAGLTIVKEVLIGDLEPADFPLLITNGDGVTQTVSSGQVTTLPAGTYTIGEDQQEGYELVDIECDNGVVLAEGEDTVTITVGLDEAVVCLITNAEVVVLPIVDIDDDELPATGLDTIRLALLSALIAALGAMFLLGTAPAPATGRRRRD